jgi:hypothetical protein
VWNGLPSHRSRFMRAFLARQRSWLVVQRLPGYAPELNPVDGLWSNIKGREFAKRCEVRVAGLEAAGSTPLLTASPAVGNSSSPSSTSPVSLFDLGSCYYTNPFRRRAHPRDARGPRLNARAF